jgi:translation initiation factor 5B
MAPKGKKGKKVADDNWDEGLGESVDPIAQADADAKAADAAVDEEEETGGGGLMAALKKNKEKRKKKGKVVGDDDLDGQDQAATPTVDESLDLAAKAPEEATMDDEDVFGAPTKKGKGGKGGKQAQQQPTKDTAGDDEEGGGVKTKAQKEKEKKEREKQRKKENVRSIHEALSVLLIAG